MIGIYRILNKINGKCYYGSSKNIELRWKRHKRDLNNKKHINCILQKSWNKYGESNFLFEVIEECELKNLLKLEQKYLDLKPEYNIGKTSSGGDNLTLNPKRNEIILKITKSIEKRYESMSDEEKRKIFSQPMEKNPNWKNGVSYVYCKCGKRIGYGNKHCSKCVSKSGEQNPFFGKKHTEEFKKKLSEQRIGKYNGNQNKLIKINNVEYKSLGEASKILNIKITTIRWRILSKNPKYINYQYIGEQKDVYTITEQKERISNPQKGKKTNFNKPFFIDEIEYRTLNEASKKLNIHPMTIKSRLKSKNSKFKNYIYKK